jgi:hypothetical protein
MHYVHLWHHLAIMLTGETTWTLESAQRADPSLVPEGGATIRDTSGRHDQSTSGLEAPSASDLPPVALHFHCFVVSAGHGHLIRK